MSSWWRFVHDNDLSLYHECSAGNFISQKIPPTSICSNGLRDLNYLFPLLTQTCGYLHRCYIVRSTKANLVSWQAVIRNCRHIMQCVKATFFPFLCQSGTCAFCSTGVAKKFLRRASGNRRRDRKFFPLFFYSLSFDGIRCVTFPFQGFLLTLQPHHMAKITHDASRVSCHLAFPVVKFLGETYQVRNLTVRW